MRRASWVAVVVWLAGCSVLNTDEDVNIDCQADPFATDCLDGQRIGCNADQEVVAEACGDGLTCKRLTVGVEQEGVCAPDCEAGSTSTVCAENRLLECQGGSIAATDCGAQQCTTTGPMEAECR